MKIMHARCFKASWAGSGLGIFLGIAAVLHPSAGRAWPDGAMLEGFGLRADWSATGPSASLAVQSNADQPRLERLEFLHAGGERMLVGLHFAEGPAPVTLVLYLDLDNDRTTGRADRSHRGVDLMLIASSQYYNVSHTNPDFNAANTRVRADLAGRALYVALDAPPFGIGEEIHLRAHVSASYPDGQRDYSPGGRPVRIPRRAGAVDPFPPMVSNLLGANRGYRHIDETPAEFHRMRVALESFENKGLPRSSVEPAQPVERVRPVPGLPLAAGGREPGREGAVSLEEVAVQVRNESEALRPEARIRFGFPFPEGALFDPAHVALADADGGAVPASVVASGFWPDGSLQWVRIDATDRFGPLEERVYTVRFGSGVERPARPAAIRIREEGDAWMVSTGAIEARLDRTRFNGLAEVWRLGGNGSAIGRPAARFGGDGVRVEAENGRFYTMAAIPPERFEIEESGAGMAVVRVEGAYADEDGIPYMRYVMRLSFHAGSSVVRVEHSHVNDWLETEFTDFRSVTWPVMLGMGEGAVAELPFDLVDGQRVLMRGNPLAVFQAEESRAQASLDGPVREGAASPGVLRIVGAGGAVGIALDDFRERWPKGFRVDGSAVTIDLLPPQPAPSYGADLPLHLRYPFVEGHYRLKWGMSFTERMWFDFGGEWTAEALEAEARHPLVAILPASWYVRTGALGMFPEPTGAEFAAWDTFFDASFAAHLERQQTHREFGFLNYGDWFGERGRNWGNNEYDTANAFFMQFARTGRTDVYRAAMAAARHQADVDIVHAYPDPYYIGANHQHGIGHTGQTSQHPTHGTWSVRYDGKTSADNGHTWSEGMISAWRLRGEARVMEAALLLGEHIAGAMAPSFRGEPSQPRKGGWSLRAVVALYHATRDPAYLGAACTIGRELIRVQDESGIWARSFPGGEPGVSNFQLGLTLAGLALLHEATGDPEVEEALVRGVEFLARAWQGVGGWPYVMTRDGRPHPSRSIPMVGMNLMNAESVAYWGAITADERLLRIVEQASKGLFHLHEPLPRAQSIGYTLRSGPATMGWLQRGMNRVVPGRPAILSGESDAFPTYLAEALDADRFTVRGPDRRVFLVRPDAAAARVRLERIPTQPVAGEEGRVRVRDEQGRFLYEEVFALGNRVQTVEIPLDGGISRPVQVEIEDTRMGIWNATGEHARVMAQAGQGMRMANMGIRRYYLRVPAGTESFDIRMEGVHTGAYGVAVWDSEGRLAGMYRNANPGPPLIGREPDEEHERDGASARGMLSLEVPANGQDTVWSLVWWASDNVGLTLEGIPPYLSRTRADVFPEPAGQP